MALWRTALFAGLALLPVLACGSDRTDRVALGRQLFEENWLRPPADDSPLAIAKGGDGLGPLFNGASCAECHHLGGVGGAGPNEHNVEIVSLALPLNSAPRAVERATRAARATHTGFGRETNVFLHRFGRDSNGSLGTYTSFRDTLRSAFPEEILPASETQVTFADGLPYQLAQRNTTALWGAGLVEAISPRLIGAVAERQKQRFPNIAGIPADEGRGRFGWRGQMSSVREFVLVACAEELGLRVKDRGDAFRDQPDWPLDEESRRPRSQPPVDLTQAHVDALSEFVRSLPAPRQLLPESEESAREVRQGERIFASTGCAVCHVPDMGPAQGVYSDFLLHDMGPTFADRVAAPLSTAQPRVFTQTGIRGIRPPGGGGYGGGSSLALVPTSNTIVIPPSLGELAKATQAFRTPALWGVADSAPYLHDGRAETLDEAIRSHGGQGEESAARYASLPQQDRTRLLAFLGTLKAPRVD